ncbi:hypothetical protein GCM10027091_39920 [Streptomyces daliensis]
MQSSSPTRPSSDGPAHATGGATAKRPANHVAPAFPGVPRQAVAAPGPAVPPHARPAPRSRFRAPGVGRITRVRWNAQGRENMPPDNNCPLETIVDHHVTPAFGTRTRRAGAPARGVSGEAEWTRSR